MFVFSVVLALDASESIYVDHVQLLLKLQVCGSLGYVCSLGSKSSYLTPLSLTACVEVHCEFCSGSQVMVWQLVALGFAGLGTFVLISYN